MAATRSYPTSTSSFVEFDLPGLAAATTHYKSATDAVGVALASEVVTGQFNTVASAAVEAGDHRGFQFLQWFIDKQVEEERTMGALLDLLASGVNLFQAQELLAGIIEE